MKKILLLLIWGLFVIAPQLLKAQAISAYNFQARIDTYNAISGGTVITNDPAMNNEFFTAIPIGFGFDFNGATHTQLGVSVKGYVNFGGNGAGINYPLFQNLPNSLSALSGAIRGQAGSEIRVQTLGSAPNRVFVAQWSNMRWDGIASNYNFQIRIHETTNRIEYHYGSFAHAAGADRVAQVSIFGNGTNFQNRVIGVNQLWNTTNTSNNTNAGNGIRLQGNAYPTEGLVFSYFPDYADLQLDIAVDNSTPCEEGEVNYLITVFSNGPSNATGVAVTAGVSGGITVLDSDPSRGTFNPGTGVWNIGNVNNGETVSLSVRASINDGQGGNTITANANITASGIPDPNAGNNSGNVAINVQNNKIPEITSISNQSVPFNGVSLPIPFTVSDAETNADDLILSVSSSNTTLIPLSGIQITGTGENRELTLSPNLNQFGNTIIGIEVSDGVCSIAIEFEVEVFNQSFTNFQAANIVVGQLDFETVSTTPSQTIAPGSNSSAVSAKGVLALGSQTTNRVLLWNSVPTENGAPANVVVGQTNFTNNGAANTQSRLRSPDGVAFSPDGDKLIVADAGNNRILIWNTIPTTNGANANVVVGQTNFTNNGNGTAANRFNRPTDVQVTADGKMIVTDRNNNRVLIFNRIPTTNNASADVVIGQTNFTNSGVATAQNRLRSPWNTSIAPDGKLLIADDGNNRILVYNQIPTTNGANADLVIGQDNFTTRVTGITPNRLNSPGVTVSPTGVVAIACFNNHRVSIFNEIPTVNGASADIVLGQVNFTQNVAYNNGAGASGAPSDRNMNQPYGINFDLNERLYVNGRAMNRMMVFGETPSQVSDLALSFASTNSTPCVKGLVSYTVTVTNNGPNNATNVVVTSALPVGYEVTESIIDRGSYNQNSGYWTIPFIGNGESVSLEMIGTVAVGQNLNSITAYASVRSYNQFDSDFSNNSGNVTVTVEDNEAPSITDIADVIVDFNETTDPISFTVTDAETPAGALTVVGTSSNQTIVPDANIVINGAGANRTVTITPAPGQFGSVIITLTVEDGICDSFTEFELFVGNVWLGNTTNWSLASNWSTGLPSELLSAFIPTAPVGGSFPVINGDVTVNNISISAGARITVNATRSLTVLGDFINSGSQNTGNGTIIFNGTSQQLASGIIGNMTVDNANGIVLGGNSSVQGVLNILNGDFEVGNNTLTLRNPIAGNTANFITQANSSLVIEGSTAGINLPAQVNQLQNLTVNNGSGIGINNDITVDGQLNLTAGAFRLGNHSLTINGTISSTSGNLSAQPNANLTINGNGNAGTLRINASNNLFNNISLNRTGAGQITVPDVIRIGGVFDISAGKWITQTGQVQIENDDPDALQGFGVNNYIVGNLRRCVTSGNRYEFPVGTIANLELSSLLINSLSEPTCINASFSEGITGTPPSGLEVNGNAIDDVLNFGFWILNPTNAAVVNYDVNLVSRGHSNGGVAAENHTVIKRNDASSNWQLLGEYSSYNASGNLTNPISVSRSNLTGFSEFAIGVSSEGSLPVELLSFNARKDFDAIWLNWITASEKDNDYFEIERGLSANQMRVIGKVGGNGTTHKQSHYEFKDDTKLFGKVYYRLRQVDFDGAFEYSPIVMVDLQNLDQAIRLYPNPVKDHVNLLFERQNVKSVSVQIFDAGGRIVFQQEAMIDQSKLNNLDLKVLAPGMYQVKIYSETEDGYVIDMGKLVKQ